MATPVRRRTRARELGLRFLYSVEMRGDEALSELDAFLAHHIRGEEEETEGNSDSDQVEVAHYARKLIEGVLNNLDSLNRWIEFIARNWRLERMAHLDRNILRLAMFELLHHPEVPFKVVINEAIDIAKRYSTAQSGSFVNGILDRARILIQEARETDPDAVPDAPQSGSKDSESESPARGVDFPASEGGPGGSGGGGGGSGGARGDAGNRGRPRPYDAKELGDAPMPRPTRPRRPRHPQGPINS